jgi:hypothetical protein
MNNIIFIAPLASLSKRTRLYKISTFLKMKYSEINISHFGWERVKNEVDESDFNFEIEKRIILCGGGYSSRKVRLMYFIWMLTVFYNCLRYVKKNQNVWALGFESAFPAILAGKIKGFKVYFDDADRFSLIFGMPKPLLKIVQILEKYTSKKSFLHIIPGRERYDFESEKYFILKNMPSENELENAKMLYNNENYIKAKIVINVNGWLGETRGMYHAVQIAKKFENRLAIILAGNLACEQAVELSKLPNVQYLGTVTNAVALSSYFASDFVLTLFDPSIKINILAESNKWGDAVKIGIGIIVNNEIITAAPYIKGGISINFKYNSIQELLDKIELVLENETILKEIKENSQKMSTKYGFFEEQLNEIF